MHGSVREELESLLTAKPSAAALNAADHVSGCAQCKSEVNAMRVQSNLFKTLQAPESPEPSVGFYARVLQRIEQRAKHSIWWIFVYSPVGTRLAYASLALSLALGSYVIAAESRDGHLMAPRIVAQSGVVDHFDPPVMGSADEQRAAVLENFVAHPVSLQQTETPQPAVAPQE